VGEDPELLRVEVLGDEAAAHEPALHELEPSLGARRRLDHVGLHGDALTLADRSQADHARPFVAAAALVARRELAPAEDGGLEAQSGDEPRGRRILSRRRRDRRDDGLRVCGR
jgi:hypothetical protein